uniref:Uncharacterized protein n=1 Tax=Sander lucioperca TaxID=283035 RepID=A0A8D0D8I0_SANLU
MSATPLLTYIRLVVSHEHGKVGEVAAGAGGVCVVGATCRCLSVKTTGSMRNTLLDSLLMEAAITWELTAKRFLSWLSPSTSIFTVAFSVDRKEPKFL